MSEGTFGSGGSYYHVLLFLLCALLCTYPEHEIMPGR